MRILSFGWTWPAFVADAKIVTRRDWSPAYAARWKAGTEFRSYNRSPRFGGRPIGIGRLTRDVILEPLADMPTKDYYDEGFCWLYNYPLALSKSARKQRWGACTFQAFDDWRNSGGSLYVIRYKILTIDDLARDDLANLLNRDAQAARETHS